MEIVAVTSSAVTLQWRSPETPNGIITQYSIQHNGTNVAGLESNVFMYTIEGLSPDTVYVLQLRAHTGAGAGLSSNITILTGKLYMLLHIIVIDIIYSMSV